MTLACGIDVGGTKIAGGVVDEAGSVLEELQVESPATDAHADRGRDREAGHRAGAPDTRSRPSASARPATSTSPGRSCCSPPTSRGATWTSRPTSSRPLGLPVVVENDANAAAWGEFQFGAGHDVDDLLLVTVGTGVGGGVVLDGSLYRGAFGVGAEIGHMRVVPDGIRCGCGNRGCFEMYASGSALVREARAAARAGSLLAADLVDRAGGDVDAITGPLITEAARAGDPFALEQLASLGRWLGEGIASLAAVLDPAVVVIGGGVSAADDLLLDPVRAAFVDPAHRPRAPADARDPQGAARQPGRPDRRRRPHPPLTAQSGARTRRPRSAGIAGTIPPWPTVCVRWLPLALVCGVIAWMVATRRGADPRPGRLVAPAARQRPDRASARSPRPTTGRRFATCRGCRPSRCPRWSSAYVERWLGLPGLAVLFWLAAPGGRGHRACQPTGARRPARRRGRHGASPCSAASARSTSRPQLVSFVLLPVVLAAWLQTERDLKPRWWLVPLMWVWSLCHGFWFIGRGLRRASWRWDRACRGEPTAGTLLRLAGGRRRRRSRWSR